MIMAYSPTTMDEEKHSATSIMKAMSDNKSLQLFKIIATASFEIPSADGSGSINTQILISKVNLTRKQYYSRISNLISAGLIRRSNGKYILTSLGKVACSVNALVDQAIHDHWKLKAIDALETKSSSELLVEEREKIIDMLIDNHELKGILSARKSDHNIITQQEYPSDGLKPTAKVSGRTTRLRMNQI